MSRRTSKRVSFSPDINERPTICLKHGGRTTRSGNRRSRVMVGFFTFRVVRTSRISPVRLLRRLGAKVARALRLVSMRRSHHSNSHNKVSSSNLTRSRSLAESIDSHRAEAIEDCIEFLNSSSSLSRSNSVSTCSC